HRGFDKGVRARDRCRAPFSLANGTQHVTSLKGLKRESPPNELRFVRWFPAGDGGNRKMKGLVRPGRGE
ncbi:hypothetical protein HAX54_031382, partial [Datura stramonium]|nr:hypothetical protein [Datura stramonium]